MLIRVNQRVKDTIYCMNSIHNNNDMSDTRDLNGLVNTISNNK